MVLSLENFHCKEITSDLCTSRDCKQLRDTQFVAKIYAWRVLCMCAYESKKLITFFSQQLAGLDLQGSRQPSGGRYVPPHLRNKSASKD